MSDKLGPFGEATAGAVGAVFANTLVFPLDVVKTRLQVQNSTVSKVSDKKEYRSTLNALSRIYKEEGVSGLYAGIGSGLFGTVVSSFSYFYLYSTIRGNYLKRIGDAKISTSMELALGAIAGALSQFVVLPIAIITTRQQTSDVNKTILETIQTIISEDGIQGLWKGLKASLVLCSNPAITYGTFERLKTELALRKGPDSTFSSLDIFTLGAISKTLATIITYPYIMAKVRLQWRPPKEVSEKIPKEELESLKYRSSLDVLRKVYRSEGFFGWYKGISTQIMKAVICQAILFVSKENLQWYTLLFFSILKSSKRGEGVSVKS